MDDKYIEALIENEKDWRRYTVKRLVAIENEQKALRELALTLKIKYSLLAIAFGMLGSLPVFLKTFL